MASLKDREKQFEDNPTRAVRKFILWAFFIVLLLSGIGWVVKIISTPAKVVEKVLDPDNILQNYEWFKQQYQDYQAICIKCDQADTAVVKFQRDAGPRDKWGFDDKQEYNRLTSIADGLKYQKQDIMAKYNARSQMADRSVFKTGDLPQQLK